MAKHNWSFKTLSKSCFLTEVKDKLVTDDPDEPVRSPEFEISIVDPNLIKDQERKDRTKAQVVQSSSRTLKSFQSTFN